MYPPQLRLERVLYAGGGHIMLHVFSLVNILHVKLNINLETNAVFILDQL